MSKRTHLSLVVLVIIAVILVGVFAWLFKTGKIKIKATSETNLVGTVVDADTDAKLAGKKIVLRDYKTYSGYPDRVYSDSVCADPGRMKPSGQYSITSDKNGAFSLAVPTAQYYINFCANGDKNYKESKNKADTIDLAKGTTTIEVELPKSNSTDENIPVFTTTQAPSGAVEITVKNGPDFLKNVSMFVVGYDDQLVTDNSGQIKIDGLEPGVYSISFPEIEKYTTFFVESNQTTKITVDAGSDSVDGSTPQPPKTDTVEKKVSEWLKPEKAKAGYRLTKPNVYLVKKINGITFKFFDKSDAQLCGDATKPNICSKNQWVFDTITSQLKLFKKAIPFAPMPTYARITKKSYLYFHPEEEGKNGGDVLATANSEGKNITFYFNNKFYQNNQIPTTIYDKYIDNNLPRIIIHEEAHILDYKMHYSSRENWINAYLVAFLAQYKIFNSHAMINPAEFFATSVQEYFTQPNGDPSLSIMAAVPNKDINQVRDATTLFFKETNNVGQFVKKLLLQKQPKGLGIYNDPLPCGDIFSPIYFNLNNNPIWRMEEIGQGTFYFCNNSINIVGRIYDAATKKGVSNVYTTLINKGKNIDTWKTDNFGSFSFITSTTKPVGLQFRVTIDQNSLKKQGCTNPGNLSRMIESAGDKNQTYYLPFDVKCGIKSKIKGTFRFLKSKLGIGKTVSPTSAPFVQVKDPVDHQLTTDAANNYQYQFDTDSENVDIKAPGTIAMNDGMVCSIQSPSGGNRNLKLQGGETDNVDFIYDCNPAPAPTIGGKVKDSKGNLLTNAQISYMINPTGGNDIWKNAANTFSADKDGNNYKINSGDLAIGQTVNVQANAFTANNKKCKFSSNQVEQTIVLKSGSNVVDLTFNCSGGSPTQPPKPTTVTTKVTNIVTTKPTSTSPTPQPTAPTTQATTTGTLTVFVRNNSGNPISGAAVKIPKLGFLNFTDTTGKTTFPNTPSGVYVPGDITATYGKTGYNAIGCFINSTCNITIP